MFLSLDFFLRLTVKAVRDPNMSRWFLRLKTIAVVERLTHTMQNSNRSCAVVMNSSHQSQKLLYVVLIRVRITVVQHDGSVTEL